MMDNYCIDCKSVMTTDEIQENQWRCDKCQTKFEIDRIDASVRDYHEWRNRE